MRFPDLTMRPRVGSSVSAGRLEVDPSDSCARLEVGAAGRLEHVRLDAAAWRAEALARLETAAAGRLEARRARHCARVATCSDIGAAWRAIAAREAREARLDLEMAREARLEAQALGAGLP
jgi:hypothetical protein